MQSPQYNQVERPLLWHPRRKSARPTSLGCPEFLGRATVIGSAWSISSRQGGTRPREEEQSCSLEGIPLVRGTYN